MISGERHCCQAISMFCFFLVVAGGGGINKVNLREGKFSKTWQLKLKQPAVDDGIALQARGKITLFAFQTLTVTLFICNLFDNSCAKLPVYVYFYFIYLKCLE